jgi:type I restriction enzyme S subunit
MTTSQDSVNWVCSAALVPQFLAYALLAEGQDIKRFGRGTTHATIYFPEVKALHICLPPVEEQREIVRQIQELLPVANEIADSVDKAALRATRLAQAILLKAFQGSLLSTIDGSHHMRCDDDGARPVQSPLVQSIRDAQTSEVHGRRKKPSPIPARRRA